MTDFKDIPIEDPHWALIWEETQSIHHEGDERSRTHPGHGYAAYTETVKSIQYEAFTSEQTLKNYLSMNWDKIKYKNYRVMFVQPMRVSINVEVTKK